MRKLIMMDFIRAPRRLDLVELRLEENSRICRDYQRRFIIEISNISLNNRDASVTEVIDKIKSCLKEVKAKVKQFESSRFGRGYRINCDDSERREFVEMISKMVHNSDYIRSLYEMHRNMDHYFSTYAEKMKLIGLVRKYDRLQSWMTMLENTEKTNIYNNS